MKKTTTFVMLLIFFSTLNAQTWQKSSATSQRNPNVQKTIAQTTAGVVIGYCSNEITNSIGTNNANDFSAAIRITAAMSTTYAGTSLTKIRFGVNTDNATLSNVIVFIRSSLTGANVYAQNVSAVVKGWNEVTLDTPYPIVANQAFYIGYSLHTTGGYPMALDDYTYNSADGGNIAIGTTWTTLTAEQFYSNLCILGVVEGAGLTQYDMELKDVAIPSIYQIGVSAPFPLYGLIKNKGEQTINSFDVNYQIGNAAQQTYTVSGVNIANNDEYEFTVPNLTTTQEGNLNVTITVNNYNGGQADANPADNTKTGNFPSTAVVFDKKIVVEEGTGTWCGYCPHGAVAMTQMRTQYPDKFIGIAIHNGDPMAVTAYDNGMGFTGFPTASINRKYTVNPTPNALEYYFVREDVISPYKIEFQKAEFNSNQTQIGITTKVTSGFNEAVNMRVAFVIVENDVTGTASGYAQVNYYSNAVYGGQLGPMGGYENRTSPIPASQMVYPEVARAILPSFNGATGSIPSNLVKNTPVTYDYTLTLPSNIKNKQKIELIGLLLESKTSGFKQWQIVNAVKLNASSITTTAINTLLADAPIKVFGTNSAILFDGEYQDVVIYNVTGQQVATAAANTASVAAPAGVYLVKITINGHNYVQKVIVK
jgi:thiol-disulfide isomerase/thioredoxin